MNDMTPKERTRAAMKGEMPDRVPVFPVITDYHASRLAGIKMSELAVHPRMKFEVLYHAWKEYGFDGFEVPMGAPKGAENHYQLCMKDGARYLADRNTGKLCLRLEEDNYPVSVNPVSQPIITKEEDLDKIPVKTCRQYIQEGYMDAVAEMVEKVGTGAFISGNNGGQTMNGLVDLRGSTQALVDLYDNPALVHRIMDFQTARTIEIGKAFIEVGVDAIYIGDAWANAGIISPKQFREFCVPYYKKAVNAFHQYGVLVYLHICGNTVPILEDMASTGTDAIEPLDPLGGVDLADAKARVGNKVCLKGGINTLTLLNGNEMDVEREVRESIEKAAAGGGYIFGTGDDIPRDTPFDNIKTMVRTVRTYGKYR